MIGAGGGILTRTLLRGTNFKPFALLVVELAYEGERGRNSFTRSSRLGNQIEATKKIIKRRNLKRKIEKGGITSNLVSYSRLRRCWLRR
jgi:hypothetical protein